MAGEPLYDHMYWTAATKAQPTHYPSLQTDEHTDVVVIGAGIVGLSTALYLARAGKSIIILEASRVGTQVTARSTGKVTAQHGIKYSTLIKNFGENDARLYARANQFAVEQIAAIVENENIECAFERTASYIYTCSQATQSLDDEAKAAVSLGLPAVLDKDMPAPVPVQMALRFDDQAQLNPAQYVRGLAAAVTKQAQLFEQSRVVSVETGSDGYHVRTSEGHTVRATKVVVATHLPVVPEGKLFAKAFPFSHPALAARMNPSTQLEGMFISADSPTYSFRASSSGDEHDLVAIGPRYKTGVLDEEMKSFRQLEDFLREYFDIQDPAYRWTNEDFQPMDGIPFIGCAESGSPNLYVAVGFNGWGITMGTAAGELLCDLIIGRSNPYANLFTPTRGQNMKGGLELFKAGVESAKHFVADRFTRRSEDELLALKPGHAAVGRCNGESVAAYRDEKDGLYQVSAVCTHMGCLVGWNPVDKTWDCPCHGSRFDYDGSVIHGPASKPLKPMKKTPKRV
tara:strand:+ start:64955 stop:66493 length:1539 start_codon:yes stop_codon:yes gene_type:complete